CSWGRSEGGELTALRVARGLVEVARGQVRVVPGRLEERRRLVAAALHHVRATRVETAAERRMQQARRRAGDRLQALRVDVAARQRLQQAQVYGCCGRSKISFTEPCSTTRPAYITITSSHNSATTPRSCVI